VQILAWHSAKSNDIVRLYVSLFGASAIASETHLFQGTTAMSAKTTPQASSVATLSFEAALKELEGIVARLEQGQVDLEDSIVLYERGQALKVHCESKLKSAESRLEKIVQDTGGKLGTEPVELD